MNANRHSRSALPSLAYTVLAVCLLLPAAPDARGDETSADASTTGAAAPSLPQGGKPASPAAGAGAPPATSEAEAAKAASNTPFRGMPKTKLKVGDVIRLRGELATLQIGTDIKDPADKQSTRKAPACARLIVTNVKEEDTAKEHYTVEVNKGRYGLNAFRKWVYDDCAAVDRVDEDVAYAKTGEIYSIAEKDLDAGLYAKSGISHGPLVVPIKYRRNDRTHIRDFPIGYYIGWEAEVLPGWSATYFLSAGLTQVTVEADATGKEENKEAFSYGVGIILKDFQNFQFGLMLGRDTLGGSAGAAWAYENRTWLGILVAYNVKGP